MVNTPRPIQPLPREILIRGYSTRSGAGGAEGEVLVEESLNINPQGQVFSRKFIPLSFLSSVLILDHASSWGQNTKASNTVSGSSLSSQVGSLDNVTGLNFVDIALKNDPTNL
jgi:hypothetical protein